MQMWLYSRPLQNAGSLGPHVGSPYKFFFNEYIIISWKPSYVVPHYSSNINLFMHVILIKGKHCMNHKTLPREHFICCQGVKMFLLKDTLKKSHELRFVIIQFLSQFEFWHLSQFKCLCFVTIWNLSHFELLSFVTIKIFHNLSFVAIWVIEFGHHLRFEFCHHLSFCVLSPFEFLSFITILVFEFHHNISIWL